MKIIVWAYRSDLQDPKAMEEISTCATVWAWRG